MKGTRWRDEQGQVLVLIMLALVAILGMVALAIDGGNAYVQRRRMQYAADAAAMAGGRALALGYGTSAIESAVQQYATTNGADSYSWYLVDNDTVHVEVSHSFSTFFAPVVGIDQMTAQATAEASVSGVSRTGNLLPIASEIFSYQYGQVYNLWSKECHPEIPGNFGWLDWNGGSRGTPELANNICNPANSGEWQIGWWVWSGPGVRNSSSVRNCLNKWIGQPVTIVLFDTVTGQGANAKYHIAAFGEFILTGYNLSGMDKYIQGRFERYVVPGEGGGPAYGLNTVVLGSN